MTEHKSANQPAPQFTESELNDMPPSLLQIVDRMQHLLALGRRGKLSKFGHGELAGLNYAVNALFVEAMKP